MANWKELVFTDSVENLGNSDLTVSSSTRNLVLSSPVSPPAQKTFSIQQLNETTSDSEQLFTLRMGAAQADGSFSSSLLNMNASVQTWIGTTLEANYSTYARINTPSFEIRNTAAGSAAKPFIKLTRLPTDGPGEDSDNIGSLEFNGEDSNNVSTKYASFDASIVDASNGSEDGAMDIRLMNAGSDASALKILPDPAEPLKALEVYDVDLWTLVQNATKHNCKKHLKMFARHTDNYGLPLNQSVLFRFSPPQTSAPDINTAYQLDASETASFIAGSTNIAFNTDKFLFDADADIDTGIGDAWFTHQRYSGDPAVNIRVHGSVWWKPNVTPSDNQQVRLFWGYDQLSLSTSSGVSSYSPTPEFVFGGYASGEASLSETNILNRINFNFTKSINAPGASGALDVFVIGIQNTSGDGSPESGTSIGQDAANSTDTVTGYFIADLEMEVLSVSA
tara:strand:- start:2485 stop:3834 length:1350 start_codon:yes stop_codon:yes gene_type:complete